MSTQVILIIRELDCAEEVAVLKSRVGRLQGIEELRFDVLNGRMTVEYNAEVLTPSDITAAVADAGMSAQVWEPGAKPADVSFWEQHGRSVMTGLSGVLLLMGFVLHWLTGGSFLGALVTAEGTDASAIPLLSRGLYLGAIVCGAWFVAPKALGAVRRLRPDMNLLMVVAIAGAIIIGEWFEASMVAFLFALALLLEHWSVGRARHAISALLDLSPATARIMEEDGDKLTEKPIEEVPVGTRILVRPGERIPLDGEVLQGTSAVDQASITGESTPVSKEPGDDVFAGTINGDGALQFRSSKPAEDTTLARIIHMVEEAQSHRSTSEQWIERFARVYTPAMMALALALALLPPLVLGLSWAEWFYRSLVILVIACPCALVISTPVSIVSGLTAAARHGVLIKGGVYLESAAALQAIAVDKTGTLTYGHPEVQEIVPLDDHSANDLLASAAALEAHSQHPLARAILRRAEEEGCTGKAAQDFTAVKGKGGEGTIDGHNFWIGSHRFMEEKGAETEAIHERVEAMADAGHSIIAVGTDDHVCGLISVADAMREDVPDTIRRLKELGILNVTMLTGDNEGTAQAVARQSGVDAYRAELLPEDKMQAVADLAAKHGNVAMVGDGVNDAPAMAAANLGIAMAAMGTDVAIETADIALMSDDLSRLPWLVSHSAKTLAIIKQNIAFALGLKGLFIVLTLFGAASLWMAIAADMGATLVVIFNGLRLLRTP